MTKPTITNPAPPKTIKPPPPASSGDSTGVITVGEGEGDGLSVGGAVGVDVGAASSATDTAVSVGTTVDVDVGVACLVGVTDGVVGGTVAEDVGEATKLRVGMRVSVGGGSVGCGGDVGLARLRVGVGDGTVWRLGLCPGAAHRSGPVAATAISIAKKITQSPYFFLFIALLPSLFMVVF
jgi:hypothetical protein